jgi:hypothetical protein
MSPGKCSLGFYSEDGSNDEVLQHFYISFNRSFQRINQHIHRFRIRILTYSNHSAVANQLAD